MHQEFMHNDAERDLCSYYPYDRLNRYVLRRCLNVLMSVSFLSLMVKSFQILGPIEANELLSAIEVHGLVIGRRLLLEDLSDQLCVLITKHFMYSGAFPYTQVWTMTATLYCILSFTFSQCNSIRRGVILSYFPVVWMILHAMFCMCCSLSRLCLGVPNSKLLQ